MRKLKLTKKQSENFWKKVKRGDSAFQPTMLTECWIWVGGKVNKSGHGSLGINGDSILAHRISWMIHNGEIPYSGSYHGVCVLHRCDNPSCINPNHLFLGSHAENMKDRDNKSRQAFGERSGNSKLTTEQVMKIREYGKMGYTCRKIATLFPVSYQAVNYILNKKCWKV